MSETLTIERFRARYHLSPARANERERLDKLLSDVLLGRGGAPIAPATEGSDQICIRTLEIPFRVELDASDATIVAVWCATVANAVDRAARGGGLDVVRFSSRRRALTDLVLGVATGQLGNAWAWRQLGLWSVADEAGADAAADGVVEALSAEPEVIVAALAEVAARGALGSLLGELGPTRLTTLATAAAPGRAWPSPDGAGSAHLAPAGGPRDLNTMARSIVTRSGIAMAAARVLPSVLLPEVRRAVAQLALLEAEPAIATTRAAAAELLEAIADTLRPDIESDHRPDLDRAQRRSDSRSVLRADATAALIGEDPYAEDDAATDAPDDGTPVGPEPVEPPRVARTELAGLLFLVNVVEELDLIGELIEAGARRGRSSRWVLHQLAQLLAPVASHDPAALAFAGLPPFESPPAGGEPERAESRALHIVADRVSARVQAVLGREQHDAAETLAEIARRPGLVRAEPGWIEVELLLYDVDTDVRRAGLDRDPGWMPWLGVAMRFVYV